jgi:hypothetical protein
MKSESWLLLLYGLPTKRNSARVSLWRRLKKFGAVQLKTSAYLLPDQPAHYERFQWLAKQIQDDGGEATLIRAAEIEGLLQRQIVQLFNDARAGEYRALMDALRQAMGGKQKVKDRRIDADMEKFRKDLGQIKQVDYFGCRLRSEAEKLLREAGRDELQIAGNKGQTRHRRNFQGKRWLTRRRPGIDRVGSAWLIRRFIDQKATFVFSDRPSAFPNAIPFDMYGVEFSHHGEDCTFETLINRFGIDDPGIREMAEMIHDADLEDGKFQRIECVGLDKILQGWAKAGLSDQQLVRQGGECFEALYQYLRK